MTRRIFLVLPLAFAVTACSDQLALMKQSAGLTSYQSMNVSINDKGECIGGDDLTSRQRIGACNAERSQRDNILQQQAEANEIKRQQERQQREAEEDAKRVAAIQATASPALLKYEAKLRELWRVSALAQFTMMCQLRSDYWHNSLSFSVQLTKDSLQQQLNIPNDQAHAGNVISHDTFTTILRAKQAEFSQSPHDSCSRFMRSPELAELDQLQVQATGNYH